MMKERFPISFLVLACTILYMMTACSPAKSNDIVAEGEAPIRISDSYSFTEGPAADARGDVYSQTSPTTGFTVGTANRERSPCSPIRVVALTGCTLMHKVI